MFDFLSMPSANIFGLYAGLCGFLLFYLSFATFRARVATGTTIGDGGLEDMQRPIRAHGNASEYIPIGLILLFALSQLGASNLTLHFVGATLVIGRLFHAMGLLSTTGPSFGRGAGMALTYVSLLTGSLVSLWLAFGFDFGFAGFN
jgi:uncharacterized membrane protein YecN with MAPEG domain